MPKTDVVRIRIRATQSRATMPNRRKHIQCNRCRQELPLVSPRESSESERAGLWACTNCGLRYFANFADDAPSELLENAQRCRRDFAQAFEVPGFSRITLDHNPGTATRVSAARHGITCRAETSFSRALDKELAKPIALSVCNTGKPVLADVRANEASTYDPRLVEDVVKSVDQSFERIEGLVKALEHGSDYDPAITEAVTRDTLSKATQDLDIFVRLGINPGDAAYPSSHSLHVAMLAASIAIRMGWDQQNVLDLGVGCVLHDLGMVRVPSYLCDSERELDDTEFSAIVRHPLSTFELLADKLDQLPRVSRMVAYQMHERCDGSGYPFGRRLPLLHQASRVAAVADVYIALASARPHRPAMMPHAAVAYLVRGVRNYLFDGAAVRALLETISLYPLGSFVELNDGRVGRVLRSNGHHYDRPVVETWSAENLDRSPTIVDLCKDSALSIRRALPNL